LTSRSPSRYPWGAAAGVQVAMGNTFVLLLVAAALAACTPVEKDPALAR
jgi:hypothetical protein